MRPGIDQIVSLGEFQRKYNWEIEVIPVPGIWLKAFGVDCLNYRCSSVSLPTVSNKTFPISIRGAKIDCSGFSEFSRKLTLTLFETEDGKVRKLLRAWRNATFEPLTGISLGRLVNSITLQLKQLDSNGKVNYRYTIINCRLVGEDLGSLESGNGVQTIRINLAYDTFTDLS